jgi:hypothetical protein
MLLAGIQYPAFSGCLIKSGMTNYLLSLLCNWL